MKLERPRGGLSALGPPPNAPAEPLANLLWLLEDIGFGRAVLVGDLEGNAGMMLRGRFADVQAVSWDRLPVEGLGASPGGADLLVMAEPQGESMEEGALTRPQWLSALRQARDLLRPGGHFLLVGPNPAWLRTRRGFRLLAAADRSRIPWPARRLLRDLSAAGIREARHFWLAPRAEVPVQIIPARAQTILAHERISGDGALTMAARLLLTRIGWTEALFPARLLLGRK